MSHLTHLCFILALSTASLLPITFADNSTGTVLVQDTSNPGEWGLLSTHFLGLTLNNAGLSTVIIKAGDYAVDDYVISMPTKTQSEAFFENDYKIKLSATGTYWFYLAAVGTTLNFDYLQVRIVANSWTGDITPIYQNPPFTWRTGYPPKGVPFTSPEDTSASDGTVATLPNPTLTSIPSHRSSTSISVWLAPSLVGIIMFAITVPIVILAYKKGKQHAQNHQVKKEEEELELEGAMENQQKNQQNRVEVSV